MASSIFLILHLLLPLIFHNFENSYSFSLSVENFKEKVIVSSPKATFTAGFYPIGDNAYCFAIWYSTPPHTLVWMANRDRPVNGKRSMLSLLKTGNLVLTDAGQSIVCENPINYNNGFVCGGSNGGLKLLDRPYVEEEENESVKLLLCFVTALGGIEVACIFLVWCFLFRNKNRKLHSGVDEPGYVLAAATVFRKFSYSELKKATKGFSEAIGRGGGGTVYKGVLSDSRVVAIKRLHQVANQGESEFLAEVSIIGRLNHMNLIDMLGYCAEGKYRLLVYEYMENGSLAQNLSSSSNALDWSKTYNIAVGTAKGLAYLHEECLEWILHCDIKPQNILLDSDYKPKVADFGLSKLLNRNSNLDNSSFSRIRGTRGYMAPEWVFNLPITSKVDVYSYGIVVLEMITGRSATAGTQITELEAESYHHERLVTWVREKRKKGSEVGSCWVDQIVDPALGSNYERNEMEILATVALECVEEDKNARPSMSQVAEKLQRYAHTS
ncbi:Putative receptor protein kinase ZmPK1 [Glycine soja]|nr:Putative receptor protein kinase ZmPK1 [Glycine soja]